MRPTASRAAHLRRCAAVAVALLAALLAVASAGASPSPQELQNRIDKVNAHQNALKASIRADSAKANSFQPRLDDLRTQLNGIEESLFVEQRLLDKLQTQLRSARARLAALQSELVKDRAALSAQLVADYKAQRPDVVNVVLDARGFTDLIERVDALKRVERANAHTTADVQTTRTAVNRQTKRLSGLEARQQRITAAQLVQRNEVAHLRLTVLTKQRVFTNARAATNAQLGVSESRRKELEHQLAEVQPASTSGGFAAHGGAYGFFQYPGTNYSVGDTPTIAARLDRLGGDLQLHLIGISGYRTPLHSMEVGGFANDPHTQGKASDTPGVEGVSEATLEHYGLTRPFGGAAEADHIQLL
jgi:septal ring factor EnvC (AmiA/AmiB activator)